MDYYKAYIPTKGKKSVMPFKDKPLSELLTLEEAQRLPEYAGVLAENTILIDIDDSEQAEKFYKIIQHTGLNCLIYQTSRGMHFLFKNTGVEKCYTHVRLACGLVADIKTGAQNSYEVLKLDGVTRKIRQHCQFERCSDLPKWAHPVKNCPDFASMGDGDGRNQNFFNYILTLQSEDFSNDEARETIELINNFVLPTPLGERELQTILREDAFAKPVFFKKDKFLFEKFAIYLKNKYHICKINDQLCIYSDGIYKSGLDKIETAMIAEISNLNRSKRAEVLAYLELIVTNHGIPNNAHLIAFKNGVYNVGDDQLHPFSPDYIITNKIPWDYNPDAKCDLVDQTLDKLACNDPEIRALLEEVAGYTFYRRNELRKSFILIGDKANGKSTYLDMINHMLGEQNVANLDLKDLGDRFSPASLFGMLANIGDDIGDDFISGQTAAQFKKVVSGSRIRGERKGEKEFFFDPYCKMLYSANNIPRIKDKSGAVIDRMIIIPFYARFSREDPDFDPFIKYKLREPEAMERFIQLGIQGLRRVLAEQAFTECGKVKKELQDYEENNNPILVFFKEHSPDDFVNHQTSEVYKKYNEFCIGNNFTAMSNIEFSKQVKKYFKFDIADRRVNGKKCRIFVK